ncbi:mortality factor 4-like protein 1 isoform X2 [Octopus sinensis]|uniref:Mortality factor 4-like protein 1 n=1 Tax=Octopus sinensis TaxID=2607531 RepID=A0A7E6F8V7_9MOLL|nr:mortality factor 4-like protein 1 isoform X2 [Octopus sinensis]
MKGERVLCYHGPLLYEAKCVKSEVKDKTVRYFIHYNGWNKNWDEWVPEARVLKYNEGSVQKQKELQKAHACRNTWKDLKLGIKKTKTKKDKEKTLLFPGDKTKHKSALLGGNSSGGQSDAGNSGNVGSLPTSSPLAGSSTSTPTEPKRKRAKTDPTVESEEAFQTKIEVHVKVPDDLKLWLVDDWDLMTKQKKLLKLPAKHNIETILEEYIQFKITKSNNKDAVKLVTQGVREYFNTTIGTLLLYKFERPQHTELLEAHPDIPMSSIYGATHLLRLFVKIGGMLAYTSLDEKSIQLLLTHLHDFLRYLQKNVANLFNVSDYISVTPEYLRKVG